MVVEPTSPFPFILLFLLLSFGFIYAFLFHGKETELWQRVRLKTNLDGPVIAAYGLLSSGMLESIRKGSIKGNSYNLIVGDNGRLIALVDLGRSTGEHIVAIGDHSNLSNKKLKRLTAMTLEGDFPKHFHMYCKPVREQELLQLFDPADMAYFVDFCRSYDFELYDRQLYISQTVDAQDETDTTPFVRDVEAFLSRNAHTLARL